jgi:hypothetical protein
MGNENERIDKRIKVTPAEVKETLQAAKHHMTIAELSGVHEVVAETIRKKLRTLREDGDLILHDGDGVFLLDTVKTLDDAAMIWNYLQWALSIGRAMTICLAPTKRHLPETKRLLREKLTPEERRELAASIVHVKALLQQAEVEDELS